MDKFRAGFTGKSSESGFTENLLNQD